MISYTQKTLINTFKRLNLANHKIFLLILFIGLFLRIYKLEELFGYGHEQDLQAWIVKDVLVDRHLRLIGQETSISGLFIGPLYYYTLIPFFALFSMNPLASYIPITLISLATLTSVYFVVTKLYGKTPGLVAALIYAASPTIIFLDRWVVPTQPTLLWIIWFYFVLIKFSKGDFKPLSILAILIGLIWHIHIAFLPLLLLVPVAIFLSKKSFLKKIKKLNRKHLALSLTISTFLIAPFVAFELRHNFQQIKGLINIGQVKEEEGRELRKGYYKFEVVTELTNRALWSTVLYEKNPKDPMVFAIPVALFIFLSLPVIAVRKGKMSKNELILIYLWLINVTVSHLMSKRLISDYYFNSLLILSLIIISTTIASIIPKKDNKTLLILSILFIFYGGSKVIGKSQPVGEYMDRKNIIEFIAKSTREGNFNCIGVNYIGEIPVRYGYRYLFWLNKVNQISPANDVAVFSIVQPSGISESEIEFRSGNIGVILPITKSSPSENDCIKPERQLFPLNGFVGS